MRFARETAFKTGSSIPLAPKRRGSGTHDQARHEDPSRLTKVLWFDVERDAVDREVGGVVDGHRDRAIGADSLAPQPVRSGAAKNMHPVARASARAASTRAPLLRRTADGDACPIATDAISAASLVVIGPDGAERAGGEAADGDNT